MRRRLILVAVLAALAVLVLVLREGGTPPDGTATAPGDPRAGTSPDASAAPPPPVLQGTGRDEPGTSSTAPSSPVPAGTDGIDVRVRGRVLDDRRRGVGGVRVALLVDGEAVHEARTEDDGSYRFEGPLPVRPRLAFMGVSRQDACECVVRAVADDGRAASRALPLFETVPGKGDVELPALVLDESFAVTIRVRGAGQAIPNARVRVGGGPPDHRTTWGWFETVPTDARGLARVAGLPRGTAGIHVTAPGWGPALAGTRVPPEGDAPVEVSLPAEAYAEVLVNEAGSEAPVAGASVSLVVTMPKPDRGWVQLGPAEGVARTDASGLTRVPVFAAGTRGWAYVRAPGRPQPWRASHAEVLWDATRTVVEVPAPSTLTWRIAPGDGGIPADGTPVRVHRGERIVYSDGFLPPEAGTVEGGRLVVPDAVAQTEHRNYALLATLPDGRSALATVPQGEAQGDEVVFRAPRTLTVRVVDPEGAPVPGILISLRACRSCCLHERSAATDEAGVRVLTPLLPEAVRVGLRGIDTWVDRQEQDADLTEGDRELVFRLPRPQRLLVHVLVDGEARLPPSWQLSVGRDRLASRQVEEDPVAGTIRATLRRKEPAPGSTVRMTTDALGTAVGTAAEDATTGESVVTLHLGTGGRIRARVTPPADGQFELFLEHFVDSIRAFGVTALPVPPEAARDGVFLFEGLEPGRYRLRERHTHLVSDVAVVTEAGGDVELPFDLSGIGIVRGRVAAPEGFGVASARVTVRGLVEDGGPPVPGVVQGDARTPPNAIPLDGEGRFALRVPGNRTITLEAWHPMLASGGAVEVRGPRDDVVLVLRQGPEAVLVLDREPTPVERISLERSVLLFGDDARGPPAWTCPTIVSGREIWFGRFEPGTYTVWLDGGTLAPLHLPGVRLGAGRTRVEGAVLRPGCRLRFDLDVAPGTVRPGVLLRAESLDGPPYARSRYLMSATQVAELTALGAGRFRVAVETLDDPADRPRLVFEDEITLDGVSDARMTVDLR